MNKKEKLSFKNENPFCLYDSNSRLIHPRLYDTFLQPIESKQLKDDGVIFEHTNNAEFGVIISHDVDHIYAQGSTENPRYLGGLKNLSQLLIHDMRSRFISKQSPQRIRKNEFDIYRFIDWELKNNISASYYFLSLMESDEDFNYYLNEIEDVLLAVAQSNGEIALHGGHQSTINMDTLLNEKSRLESVCNTKINGFRSHYLKWTTGQTENILDKAKFEYDTSWGSAQQPGFVKGFCTPHPVWDAQRGCYCSWIEVPLIAMDCSFFDYMKLNEHSAWELFLHLVNKVKSCNGILTILWHNSYHKHLNFYWKMLDYLQNQDCRFDTSMGFVEQAKNSGYIDKVKSYYGA
jgi:hypothetical protein